MGTRISDEDTLADLKRVYDQLGHVPLTKEYDALGKYSPAHVQHRFGTFADALALIGISKSDVIRVRYTDEDLNSELNRLTGLLGHLPSFTDIENNSTISSSTFERRYGKTCFNEKPDLNLNPEWNVSNVSEQDGGWVAGITDGEGCFALRECGSAEFKISLRVDDALTLERIRRIINIPDSISVYNNQHRRDMGQVVGDTASLHVSKRPVLIARIIPFFDKFSLHSKKAIDYALFREGVLFLYNSNPDFIRRRKTATESNFIVDLARKLKAIRKDPTAYS